MKKISLMMAAAILFSMNVFAASTQPSISKSTATPESTGARILKKFSASYFGQLSTTSIGNPSRFTPDNFNAKSTDAINLYNSLGIGYKVATETQVKLSNRFLYVPVNPGSDLKLLNHRLFVERANLINTANNNLKVTAGLELPSEKGPREVNHMVVSPRFTASHTYTLPRSRWSINLSAYYMNRIFSQDMGAKQFDEEAYISPTLSYKISNTVSATAEYEACAHHARSKDMTDWSEAGTDLQLGAAWDITPKFSINPYIQLQPGGRVSLDTSSIGAYISGTIL